MKKRLLLALALLLPLRAHAQLLTSISANAKTITSFAGICGQAQLCVPTGPLQVGASGYAVTLLPSFLDPDLGPVPTGGFAGNGSALYGFGTNGIWDGAPGGFLGTNVSGTEVNLTLTFGFAVSEIGAFMNYVPGGATALIRALDFNGNVLDQFDLLQSAPISTPGAFNGGAFRGIRRTQNDIYGFSFTGSFLAARDLQVVTTAPEPSTFVLTAAGVLLVAAARRRHQTSRA